jgi:hypothetical protein
METFIFNQLENLYWNYKDDQSFKNHWTYIDEMFENRNSNIHKTINFFLCNLIKNHDIPYDVYHKLLGISRFDEEKHFVTSKQKRYAIMSMIIYWDQKDNLKYYVYA